ncbi:MAG: hypothetical protein A2V64_11465 [Bacteroidetes bacterium RBG_13_43_22]|nr:MAG: hypothetical protein A2V64_11465 [Bacteroidetes bacterium RBG_13_43_22]
MKRATFILIILCFAATLLSQAPFPGKEEIGQFSRSKTCIVLEDDPLSDFNFYIKDAMKEYWTITPYEFITVSDFNVRRISNSLSFIVLTETNYDKDKSNSVFNFINLLQGKNVDKLGEMPEICAIPLSFAGEEDSEYGYKLGAILSFMQKHAQLIMEDPSKTGRKYLKYYNENIPAAMGRTILIKKEDLAPEIGTIEKIKAIYSNKVEIVSEEDIVNAIKNKTPNTLILHKVAPVGERVDEGYCFKMLIGTDDANMYYYNLHSIDKNNPNGFLPADFKRLARFD